MDGNTVNGDAGHVADVIGDGATSKACDEFMLAMPVQPRSLRDFVELDVPELQGRGRPPPDCPGAALPANIGLPHPADPFQPAAREKA